MLMLYFCFFFISFIYSVQTLRFSSFQTGNHGFTTNQIALYPSKVNKRLYSSNDIDSSVTVDNTNERKKEIISILNEIIDPTSDGLSIIESKMVKNIVIDEEKAILNVAVLLQAIDLSLELTNEVKKLCLLQLSMLEWVNDVSIEVVQPSTAKVIPLNQDDPNKVQGMNGVKNVIAVSSCKGGVGKSTVSVNLAYTLHKAFGYRVGILDADIYGPSLPTMTKPSTTEKIFNANRLLPLSYEGVKLMSLGFINRGAAIMRGPMVNQVLNQFVSLTDWGDLDYLIIDMPPGTGDIQLTLAQIMNITAAVIVTTPQRLSFVDVVKGIDLFDTVNVPSVAVVENMAEYSTYKFDDNFYENLSSTILKSTSSKEEIENILKKSVEEKKINRRIFGAGHNQRLKDMWGIENIISFPLQDEVSISGDSGIPYVIQYQSENDVISCRMKELAKGVIQEIDRLTTLNKQKSQTSLTYDETKNTIIFNQNIEISPFKLRCDCRCAVCVEEFTGKNLLDVNKVSKLVRPLGMSPIGKYAMSVDWSDGHKSLYPFKQIAKIGDSLKGK
eukprot:gene7304-9951_t